MRAYEVLIVDDNEDICRFLIKYLTNVGYRVNKANTGSQAKRIIRNNHNYFDAAVIDYNLPDMKGDEVVRYIRKKGLNTGIVIISGSDNKKQLEDSFEDLDIYAIVAKPFDIKELYNKIDESLQFKKLCETKKETVEQDLTKGLTMIQEIQQQFSEPCNDAP